MVVAPAAVIHVERLAFCRVFVQHHPQAPLRQLGGNALLQEIRQPHARFRGGDGSSGVVDGDRARHADAALLAAPAQLPLVARVVPQQQLQTGVLRQRCGPLSGAEGSVLDPIVSIRYQIVLEPDESATVDIVTGMTDTRESALHLIDKYQDRHLADRVFELAWTHSQVVLRQLNASETDAQLYGRLANNVIYPNASLRAEAGILSKNQRGQSGLWAYAISGDLPIVLLQIRDPANIELARQMVQAHAYWRLKGLVVDLVIWYEDLS
eukprot:gene22604-25610_t